MLVNLLAKFYCAILLNFCSRDSQSFLKSLKTLFVQVNEELVTLCEPFTQAYLFCFPGAP